MDERLERWKRLQNSAAEGNVDALFSILEEDPLVFEAIDEKAFVSTPLHEAVKEEHIHIAKEILNLKPSFARKRDHLGRSPLYLALEKGHKKLVTWLINVDSELVLVKAKGMVTLLHYAAQINDESSLANFMFVCPSSIEDLTVKSETAVHVAVKNNSFRAVKVLVGWLRHSNREEILSCKDEDGNNALHTAIFENQPAVVKLLIKYMDVNVKKGEGFTALDIFHDRQDWLEAEFKEILLGAKAKRANQLHPLLGYKLRQFFHIKTSLVDYFSEDISFDQKILIFTGFGDKILYNFPLEVRNTVLVVAVLIATTTYQAALSPPGGYWQDYSNQSNNSTVNNKLTSTIFSLFRFTPSNQSPGSMIQGSFLQLLFLTANAFGFLLSVTSILILIKGLPFYKIIIGSTAMIVCSFALAVIETLPYAAFPSVFFVYAFLVYAGVHFLFYCPLCLYLTQRLRLSYYSKKMKLQLGSFEKPRNLCCY